MILLRKRDVPWFDHCAICGAVIRFGVDDIVGEFGEDGVGNWLLLCQQCLEAGPEGARERGNSYAAWLQTEASAVRGALADLKDEVWHDENLEASRARRSARRWWQASELIMDTRR